MRARSIIFAVSVCFLALDSISAQEPSDELALHQLLGEATLSLNALDVCKRASRMPADERFEFLARWVLPNEQHPTFRLVGDFHSTNPAPPVNFQTTRRARKENESPAFQYLKGKEALAIPAMELIEAARASGRLNALRDRVLSFEPTRIEQQRSILAMLFLIEVASADYPAAEQFFDRFVSLDHDVDRKDLSVRWRDLLILWMTFPDDRARQIVGDYIITLYPDIVLYYPDQRYDVLTDYLRVLHGIYHHLETGDDSETVISESVGGTAEFIPFGFTTAFHRGHGRPTAMWALNRDEARKIAGHEMDYLSYRMPLRGDYVVEADLTGNDSLRSSFMAAGARMEYVDHSRSLKIGTFRFETESQEFDIPGLSQKEWVRHRAVVRDGVLTHYINGYEVFQNEISRHHEPWVAVANWRRSQGRIRNLRVHGSPKIPEKLNLTADPELAGWVPYYEEGFAAGESHWTRTDEPEGGYGLAGNRRSELAGTGSEELIRYIRPMVEGGTVEYEFWYREGVSGVHPAIGRLAILLNPDGVRIHWITDGRFDRSGLDPLNEFIEPQHQRGPRKLPLIENDWNHVAVNLGGENVRISLNGQLVCERTLNPGNCRSFGLFRFCGETAAHARNVVWRGNWPRELAPPADRQLANSVTDALDARRRQLPAVFAHDFRKGLPGPLFAVEGDESYLKEIEQGVSISNVERTGIQALRTCLQIGGDYDIILTFEDFQTDFPVTRERAGIGLMTHLHNLTEDSCALYRRNVKSNSQRRAVFAHKAFQEDGSLLYTGGGDLIEGATSGKLRLARRGKTVYGLVAEYDSPHYRLVYEHNLPDDDIAPQGLRIVTQCAKNLRVEAILTGLEVRAERLYGLPATDSKPVLKLIDRSRKEFQQRAFDFTTEETFEQQFVPIGNVNHEREQTTDGVRLKVSSNGGTTQARYFSAPQLQPVYDVEADLKINQIDTPQVMGRHSEVVLETGLRRDPEDSLAPIEAALILRLRANGVKEIIARVYRPRQGTGITYLPIRSVPVDAPDKLRICVHGKTIYFFYSDSDSEDLRVLAEYEVDSEISIGNILLNVQASGEDRMTDVTWKSLSLFERQDEQSD